GMASIDGESWSRGSYEHCHRPQRTALHDRLCPPQQAARKVHLIDHGSDSPDPAACPYDCYDPFPIRIKPDRSRKPLASAQQCWITRFVKDHDTIACPLVIL